MLLSNDACLFPTDHLSQISSTLKFLLDVFKDKPDYMDRSFLLKNYEAFKNENILKFIANRGDAITQREELVELLDHYERHKDPNNSQNSLKSLFKSNLETSVGLVAFLDSVDTRYPITTVKKLVMIGIEVFLWMLGVGLYALDVLTDVFFAIRIHNDNNTAFIIIVGKN